MIKLQEERTKDIADFVLVDYVIQKDGGNEYDGIIWRFI